MRTCAFTIPFMIAASMAEMMYLFISLLLGNWAGAINSIAVYFIIVVLIYGMSVALAQMGIC